MITLGQKFDFGGRIGGTWRSYSLGGLGQGVNVYVFDSGIKIEHQTFQASNRRIASHFQGKKSTDTSRYCGPGVVMVSLPYLNYSLASPC